MRLIRVLYPCYILMICACPPGYITQPVDVRVSLGGGILALSVGNVGG